MDTNTWLQSTGSDQGKKRSSSPDNSLGEQIDNALGEFDAKLTRLRDAMDDKKSEIAKLEEQIAAVEKEQAKAFKSLLSKNTQIKKMLAPKTKSRSRRKGAKAKDESPKDGKGGPPPASGGGFPFSGGS